MRSKIRYPSRSIFCTIPCTLILFFFFFFFQAEDGIRDLTVTGVQTCALPISGLQGEALTFQDTVKTLTLLMALAVFVMYVILAILYESYVHPLTVLSTLPTALVGGLLTLYLFGEQASLYAFVGMFMLMGIVKKNGIMIVDFARQRVAAGETAERAIHDEIGRASCREKCRSRWSPY